MSRISTKFSFPPRHRGGRRGKIVNIVKFMHFVKIPLTLVLNLPDDCQRSSGNPLSPQVAHCTMCGRRMSRDFYPLGYDRCLSRVWSSRRDTDGFGRRSFTVFSRRSPRARSSAARDSVSTKAGTRSRSVSPSFALPRFLSVRSRRQKPAGDDGAPAGCRGGVRPRSPHESGELEFVGATGWSTPIKGRRHDFREKGSLSREVM